MNSLFRSLLSGWLIMAGSKFAGVGLLLLMQVLLARLIVDTAGYGLFAWATSIAQLGATVVLLGFQRLCLRYVSVYAASGQFGNQHLLIKISIASIAITSLLTIILAMAWLQFIHVEYTDPQTADVLRIVFLAIPMLAFGQWAMVLAQAHRWYALAEVPERVLRPLAMIALCGLGVSVGFEFNVISVTRLFVVATAVWTGCAILIVLYRYYGKYRNSLGKVVESSRAQLYSMWRKEGGYFYAGSLVDITLVFADIILLGLLAKPVETAEYFAASRAAQLVGLPMIAIASVLAPRMAVEFGKKNFAGIQTMSIMGAHFSLWPSLLIGLVIVGFGGELLSIFGPAYINAVPLLQVLVFAQLLGLPLGNTAVLLNMTGNQHLRLYVSLVGLVLLVALGIILIPGYGAMGAAIAYLCATSFIKLSMYIIVVRRLGVQTSLLGRRYLPVTAGD
jgi:O-antigen/teichoic acid export membrane protein